MRTTTHILTALVVALAVTYAHSQDITYNLDPMYELGEELWAIPVGGELTMSADGSKMLIASIADSAFFVVDVATGEYRRLMLEFYRDNTFGNTFYVVDNDVTTVYTVNTKTEGRPLVAWDVDGDTLISSRPISGIGPIGGVSKVSQRMIYNSQLLELTTQELVRDSLPMSFLAWFDEERGVFYASKDRKVLEYSSETGDVLREWSVRSRQSVIRRPTGSEWIYAFSIRTDISNPQNWVEAIHLTTGERIVFEEYFQSRFEGQPDFEPGGWFYTAQSGEAISSGRNDSQARDHLNAIWQFDAGQRKTNTLVAHQFVYEGRPTEKRQVITPDRTRLLHSWFDNWKDSTITRCNALVQAATSVSSAEAGSDSPRCRFSDAPAVVYNYLGEQIATVDIINDAIAPHQLDALPEQPLWVVQGECVRPVPGTK